MGGLFFYKNPNSLIPILCEERGKERFSHETIGKETIGKQAIIFEEESEHD